jgi:CRP-like cAMP-binding protein
VENRSQDVGITTKRDVFRVNFAQSWEKKPIRPAAFRLAVGQKKFQARSSDGEQCRIGAVTDAGFLQRLAAEDRAALDARLKVYNCAQGEFVISHLDLDRDVFFVLEGRVRATLYSRSGRVVDYRDIGPGDLFGEMAAIDGAPRSATVEALEPARLGRLSEAAFHELVETRPLLTWVLLKHLSAQIRRLTERVFEFSTLLVRDRLIRELLRLAEAAGGPEGRAEIHPAPTHLELAHRISSHREVVSREMSALAKAGLVKKRGGALVVSDLHQLRSLIADAE